MKKFFKELIFVLFSIFVIIEAFNWFRVYRAIVFFGWKRMEFEPMCVEIYLPPNWEIVESEDQFYIYKTTNHSKELIAIGVTGVWGKDAFTFDSIIGEISISDINKYNASSNYTSTEYATCNILGKCIFAQAQNTAYLLHYDDFPEGEILDIGFVFISPDITMAQVKKFMNSFSSRIVK